MHLCYRCHSVDIEEDHIKYCRACHAARTREWRKTHKLSGEARRRDIIRSKITVYIKRGVIRRQPCDVCGSPDSHPHHPDYAQELSIRWLCTFHHWCEHNIEKWKIAAQTIEKQRRVRSRKGREAIQPQSVPRFTIVPICTRFILELKHGDWPERIRKLAVSDAATT